MIGGQVSRWLTVGLITNGILYAAYLALTRNLLAPSAAMTVVYVAGVLLGFVGHRTWSFRHDGRVDSALLRYVAAYAAGYLINLGGLQLGVDVLGWPHEIVQGVMILVVAAIMFLMQKYLVFAESH